MSANAIDMGSAISVLLGGGLYDDSEVAFEGYDRDLIILTSSSRDRKNRRRIHLRYGIKKRTRNKEKLADNLEVSQARCLTTHLLSHGSWTLL